MYPDHKFSLRMFPFFLQFYLHYHVICLCRQRPWYTESFSWIY